MTSARAATGATAQIVRLGGADRYQTAQILAEKAFPKGTANAVLARGQDFASGTKGFADALAATYMAGYLGAPILLTNGDSLPAATLQALKDLKVKTVGVLGGPLAVSDSVVNQLQVTASTNAAGGNLSVGRASGADRYQTAALAAEFVPASFVHTIAGVPTAIVARGDDFPDALAAGPLADAAHLPLILTNPDSLNPAAVEALHSLKIGAVIILGGTSAVSTATEQAVQALGIKTQRLAGANRQQTAVAVANYAIANLGFSNATLAVARGDAYPDALSGGPEAGQSGPAPILLTASTATVGPDTLSFITNAVKNLGEIDLLGLQGAISDAALAELQALFGATTSTTAPGLLPGLNIPGLGALLALLSPSQQQVLLPVLTALPASVLSLVGGVAQNVPAAKVPALGGLLAQPTSLVTALTALVPALPSGGMANLGGLLSALPAGQVAPVGQLLSNLPVGSTANLSGLLTSLPAAQLGPLGGLLTAANSSQLGLISQVLSAVVGGGGGGLITTLLGLLGGLPGVSVLSSLSPANAGQLNALLGALPVSQVPVLGGVLSGIGATPANLLGSLLGSLGAGGPAQLGSLLTAVPSGQGSALGAILADLSPQGGSAFGNLLVGTPAASIPQVAQLMSALP